MQDTPTGCGSHVLTNLRVLKNEPTSRSVNDFPECSDLDPPHEKQFILPARSPPRQ